jgi:UDP-2,3-diacylglucosamine pyrophosphatase LpxH
MARRESVRQCTECPCPISNRGTSERHNICETCGNRCQGSYQRKRFGGGESTSTLPPQYVSPDIDAFIRERVDAILKERAEEQIPDFTAFEDGATILASDIHVPLHNVRAFDALVQFVEQQPKGYIKRLVLAGDVFDGTNLSRYDKLSRSDGHSGDLGDEMAMGRSHINALVRAIPDGEHWIQSGNHELGRLHRALAANRGIPAEPLEMEALLKFYEYDDRLKFYPHRKLSIGRGDQGTVEIIHGEKYNKHTAATILADNLYRNIVQGHTHRPQTFWIKGRFGMVNGHLHDLAKAGYAVDPDWSAGFSILEHWDNGRFVNPYFVRVNETGSFAFNGKVYRG